MSALNKRDPILLFCGDIIIFYISLWLTLLLRYREIPTGSLFVGHALPFSILYIVWLLVFFIAGLYEKRAIVLKNRLPNTILKAQITNSVIAVLFFYFIPYFGITPKTNLFINLIVSLVLIALWRIYGYEIIGPQRKQNALLIGRGEEMRMLRDEVNNNKQYRLHFISSVDLDNVTNLDFQEEIVKRVYSEDVSIIVVDFKNTNVDPIVPHLYNLIFSGIAFIDMHRVYEDVFGRVPLSLIGYSWFLENISLAPKISYDVLKRIFDFIISLPLAIISLIVYPFVFIAMQFDEGKGLFSIQERVGQSNHLIKMFKFRTMKIANDGGKWGEGQNHVTKLGEFLRKSRIDELPQLWNVVRGDISLIGPRPEFNEAVKQYEKEIPYYGVRHLIKPGLSGWAQIYHDNHPHHGVVIDATREKLSYDLYYLKNRSFLLDIKIALQTINIFLSRKGQ